MLKVKARSRHASTLKQNNLFEDALEHLPFCLISNFSRFRGHALRKLCVSKSNKFLEAFSVNKSKKGLSKACQ